MRLSLAVLLVLGSGLCAYGQAQPAPLSEHMLRNAPMTIAMSTFGRFAKGELWYLSVNSAGQAELTIGLGTDTVRRTFTVPAAQLEEFRKAIGEQRFMELQPEYGQIVPDGSTTTVTITVGQATRSVKVHYLMNWVRSEPERLREPARAVRVAMLLRGWFDDAQAVDLRAYQQKVLDAAP